MSFFSSAVKDGRRSPHRFRILSLLKCSEIKLHFVRRDATECRLVDLCDSPFCINETGVHETRSYSSLRPTINQSAAPFIQLACLPMSLHVSTTCCLEVPWICLSASRSIHYSHLPTSYHCVSTKDVSLHWTKSLGIGQNPEPEKLGSFVFLHLPFCRSASVHVPIRRFTYHLVSSQHISKLCSPFHAVPRPHVAHIHDDACMNW